jgi:DNA-binding beta-propeller fold protein YncE
MSNEVTYGIVDVARKEIVTRNFITDGTERSIRIPYGIAVNPVSKDIYVTDAKNYVSPGTLYCFDREGKQKWNVRTGDIPAHFVLLIESSIELNESSIELKTK